MIDYTYRYDPDDQDPKHNPTTAEEARQALILGNKLFAEWMSTCLVSHTAQESSQFIIPFHGMESAMLNANNKYPTQSPFAVVLGCSDARVPTEMLFGQGFNDLFVIRVAGNVIGDAVQGTIDFSLMALSKSVRVLVVLGHANCGAVKGAVDAYLEPQKFWSRANSSFLRLMFQRIFVAVRESDNALKAIWGTDAASQPGYRGALIDMSVCLNAAQSAFAIRQQVEAAANWDIEVLYGAYDVSCHQVCMPLEPDAKFDLEKVTLVSAPAHPREFSDLAIRMAMLYLQARS